MSVPQVRSQMAKSAHRVHLVTTARKARSTSAQEELNPINDTLLNLACPALQVSTGLDMTQDCAFPVLQEPTDQISELRNAKSARWDSTTKSRGRKNVKLAQLAPTAPNLRKHLALVELSAKKGLQTVLLAKLARLNQARDRRNVKLAKKARSALARANLSAQSAQMVTSVQKLTNARLLALRRPTRE